MKTLLLSFILSLTLTQSTDRDHYISDYKRIQKAYKSYPSLVFNVSYRDFQNAQSTRPDTTFSAKYYFKGNKFYYKNGSTEVLKNDDYLISVDHFKKAIVIYRASEFKDDYLPFQMVDSFFIKSSVSLHYIEKDQGKKGCYTMDFSNNKKLFNKMEMQFDKGSYLMDNIRFYISPDKMQSVSGKNRGSQGSGNSTGSVEYVFSNYQFGNLDDNFFGTARFVSVSDNKFKTTNQYSGFKVIPLIQVQKQSK